MCREGKVQRATVTVIRVGTAFGLCPPYGDS